MAVQQKTNPSDKTWMDVFQGLMDKGGVPLSEGYCALDNGLNAWQLFDNNETYQINCFLVPNFRFGSDRYTTNGGMYLQYNKDVLSLTIEDQLFDFGIKGSMIVSDTMGSVSLMLEQFISYDLVINIMYKIDDTRIMRFEPYVMSIINVVDIAKPNTTTKLLKVDFEDVLTAEAKKHSIATLLKFDTTLKSSKTFPEAFKKIVTYLTEIMKGNAGDKLVYGKEIKFADNKFILNTDQNSLIEPIFDEIDPDASIYDLITQLQKDACVEIKMDTTLTSDLEMIGNVLIPVFFKEEYPDFQNYYYILAGEESQKSFTIDSNAQGIFIGRPFTCRNFYMPFQCAFNSGTRVVFESFTTAGTTTTEADLKTINGVIPIPISNIRTLSSNTEYALRRWKNISFISSSPQGGSNRLVYFNWIYEFYNKVFLRGTLGAQNIKFSNITPNFFMAMQGNTEMMSDKGLAEKNSNILMIRNEKADPLNEILMQIGKSVASLVFLNTMYSFDALGSMLRHSNEVVNLYTPHTAEETTNQTLRTDFIYSDNVVLYVTGVVHKFEGTSFTDTVICNRIYEQISQ